jgi:uncharacterized repeat protein (TIGR01451 family)
VIFMKRVTFASLGAVALVAALPFVGQVSALAPINLSNIAVAQNPQKKGPVQVRLAGEKQVVTKDEQGKEKITWQALSGRVKSGDVLRYTVIAENKSDRTIKNLAINGPVPRGTLFKLESVQAPSDAQITYSIDGGRNFVASPTISVKLQDGKIENKPAPANAYTHIRVKLPVISAKGKVQATYETKVR